GYGGNSSSYNSSPGMSSGTGTSSSSASTSPSMAAVGPITGFGTVHLNGLVFETTTAAITIDGRAATQDDLRPGQFIEVKGHHDATQNRVFADQIDFSGNVVGPVSAVDDTTQTLVVLGQTVHVTEDTSF